MQAGQKTCNFIVHRRRRFLLKDFVVGNSFRSAVELIL